LDINKPSLGTSPNSKALPRRHIEAVLDRRSHRVLVDRLRRAGALNINFKQAPTAASETVS
jgi:hypothetical protein